VSQLELRGPDGATYAINRHGAELATVTSADGHNWLWDAGAAWPKHAPILFPAICRHPDDSMRLDGAQYPIEQHGFTRDHLFAVEHRDDRSATLELRSNAETRARFPFEFALRVRFEATDGGLQCEFDVANLGDEAMPFALARDRIASVRISSPPRYLRRDRDGLLLPKRFPLHRTYTKWCELDLDEFANGAEILEGVGDAAVELAASAGRTLRLEWQGFDHLTLWSKPGAKFLCLEPWLGLPAPADGVVDERERSDLVQLEPGASRSCSVQLTLGSSQQ
jgi:galactose mutarotase-like enzyme